MAKFAHDSNRAERVISLNEALQLKSAELSDALRVIQTELQSAAALQAAMLPKTCERNASAFIRCIIPVNCSAET